MLLAEYHEKNKESLEDERILTIQLKEIDTKIDSLEESRYVLNEISQDTVDKFFPVKWRAGNYSYPIR